LYRLRKLKEKPPRPNKVLHDDDDDDDDDDDM
jgi:hypothetical protein